MKPHCIKLTCLLILTLITCLFIGCRSNADSAANAMKSEPLKFRITWKTYSGRGETIQKIVDTYNADRTARYHIKMVDGDEDLNTIDNLLMQQSSVDIYVLPYRFVKYFGAENKLMDLTTDFAREKDFFYPNLWNLGVVNGKTYGIPWLGHSIGLIYNKDLLAKAGVDPQDIKSVQDLLGACEKIEANTQARGIGLVGANHNDVSWMVNQFVYGFGSTLVDKEGLKVAVNNDKSRNAIAFYKNDLGQHAQKTWVNDTGVEVMDYFRKQQVAFEFQGLWGVTDIWKNGHPFEAGVISLDDLGLYSEVGPMMLALPVNLNTEKKEAAVDFIRFLVSKQAQEKIMDGEYSPEHDAYYPFRIPARKDLGDSLVFKKYPEFSPFLKGFMKPSVDVPVPGWQRIKDQYYAPGLHQVMADQVSIEAFLQTVETEGNRILIERTK